MIYNQPDSKEFVSRVYVIENVLRTIGANDDVSDFYLGNSLEFYIYDEVESSTQNGFLYCAVANHFVEAEKMDNHIYKIYPQDNITFYEVCQIMSSCLQDKELKSDDAYIYCAKNGIIKFSDIFFWKSGNEYVSKDEFDIMLKRFLDCKRYKYFVFVPTTDFNHSVPFYGYGHWEIYYDEYRVTTYNEYLSSEQYNMDRKYANE